MKDLTETVERVLREHEDARDSDFRTIGWVIKITKPEVMSMSFSAVLWNHKALGLPSFETIRRTRQKLQHDKPELRGKMYLKRMEKTSGIHRTFCERRFLQWLTKYLYIKNFHAYKRS